VRGGRRLSALLRALLAPRPPAARPDEVLPKGWLTPEEDGFVPPRGQWLDPQASISHYYRWVWEYLAYLQLLCDLRRESAVLELGCSHGRTAHGLLQYLRHPGFYRGLDVDGPRLGEARDRIGRGHPNFEFILADVYNRHYRPEGRQPAASYVFPFGDAVFDVIYAASLFTHLLPDEMSNYLRQSGRVLKAGGRCLFSVFLLDAYRGPGTAISPHYAFDHPLPGLAGVAVRDPLAPDDAIAYRLEQVEERARAAGLRLLRVIPGLWSNSPGWAVNEQDMILLGQAAPSRGASS
jgi:SAM-dependent methyltransferase